MGDVVTSQHDKMQSLMQPAVAAEVPKVRAFLFSVIRMASLTTSLAITKHRSRSKAAYNFGPAQVAVPQQ